MSSELREACYTRGWSIWEKHHGDIELNVGIASRRKDILENSTDNSKALRIFFLQSNAHNIKFLILSTWKSIIQ